MLLHKSVVHDSRVRREAKALAAAGHEVVVVHLAPNDIPGSIRAEGYRIASALPYGSQRLRLPLASHRLEFMRRFVGIVRSVQADVVHVHDAAMLAPGWVGAKLTGAQLVYDSHELATGVAYRSRSWAALVWALERLLIRRCSAVITVSDGIAARLQRQYGLARRPTTLRNIPDTDGLDRDGAPDLRKCLGIGAAPLVLHQGALAPGRGCEELVRAIASVPQAHLVFLGDAWPGYDGVVEELAERVGVTPRVHRLAPVPTTELLRHTREADVGVALLQDTCENHRMALPNKVFEYIAAGVPVVVSRLPELEQLVARHGVGWTVQPDQPDEIASVLRAALDASSDPALRARMDVAAEVLHWNVERGRLIDLYARLGGGA